MNCPVDYNCAFTAQKAFGPDTWATPLMAIGFIIAVILTAVIVYGWIQRR